MNTFPWVLMGDFNAYLLPSEKSGGKLNVSSIHKFSHCLSCCELDNFGYKSPPFTWEERCKREVGQGYFKWGVAAILS